MYELPKPNIYLSEILHHFSQRREQDELFPVRSAEQNTRKTTQSCPALISDFFEEEGADRELKLSIFSQTYFSLFIKINQTQLNYSRNAKLISRARKAV